MSEDVLEISAASARRLYNALVRGFQQEDTDNTKRLEPIHTLADLTLSTTSVPVPDLVADRVVVGKSTGECPCTGVTLRLLKLDKEQKDKLRGRLLELSNFTYEEFHKSVGGNGRGYVGGNYKGKNNAAKELESYIEWME